MIKIHDLSEKIEKKQILTSGSEKELTDVYKKNFIDCIPILNELIEEAMCFDAGKTETFLNYKIIPELVKLPYSTIWTEFEMVDGILGILAYSMEDKGLIEDDKYKQDIEMFIFNRHYSGQWACVGICRAHPSAEDQDVHSTFPDNTYIDGKITETQYYVHDAMKLLCLFLSVLNCTNIKIKEVNPGKFINKKRISKGKKPLHSYWTLHINGEKTQTKYKGGTHSSPRVHLRRGHIREYKKGKYTWIQACVVGKKELGVVEKDYKFNA